MWKETEKSRKKKLNTRWILMYWYNINLLSLNRLDQDVWQDCIKIQALSIETMGHTAFKYQTCRLRPLIGHDFSTLVLKEFYFNFRLILYPQKADESGHMVVLLREFFDATMVLHLRIFRKLHKRHSLMRDPSKYRYSELCRYNDQNEKSHVYLTAAETSRMPSAS